MDLFATPLALLLLPLPLLVMASMPPRRDGDAGAALVVPEAIAARLEAGGGAVGAGRSRFALASILWVALILALAGPRQLVPTPALPVSGRDIVLVLDLSGSMDRKDFDIDGQPARRLDAVKKVAIEFVRKRAGDRVGLVIFAERAFFAAAPSFDIESIARSIDEATIGIAGRSTAIGDGLGLALKRLEASTSPSRVVILLSDGANNAGTVGPSDVAVLARELGIRVHTIALGEHDLDTTTDDPDAVDAATLRRVAELSGGTAFRVRTTADLEAVGRSIDAMEASRTAAPAAEVWRDWWIYPAAVAFVAALAIVALEQGLVPIGVARRRWRGPARGAASREGGRA